MRYGVIKALTAVLFVGLSGTMPLSAAKDQNQTEDCSRELLLSYFPAPFVTKTFEKFKVERQKWPAILTELAERDKEVVRTVEEKAAKMNPNPLRDSKNRQEAVRLFRETLYSLFSSVMEKNGITDSDQIHRMLDDIQYQKANHFAQCMEKQKEAKKGGDTSDANDNDDQDQMLNQDESTADVGDEEDLTDEMLQDDDDISDEGDDSDDADDSADENC